MNILLGFGVLSFASPRLDETALQVSHKLKDLQSGYIWSHSNNVTDIISNATTKWDAIQVNYECCGLHSPKDWLPFKPTGYQGEFPISCCQNFEEPGEVVKHDLSSQNVTASPASEKYCLEKEGIWTEGCVEKIDGLNDLIRVFILSLIMMNLVLSIMAGIVIIFQQKPDYVAY